MLIVSLYFNKLNGPLSFFFLMLGSLGVGEGENPNITKASIFGKAPCPPMRPVVQLVSTRMSMPCLHLWQPAVKFLIGSETKVSTRHQ